MHIARLASRIGGAVALAGCLALGGLMAPSAFAQNPPGNNGTIKIDDVEFDDDPNNEPHVACTFQVDFYGYDQGDLFADLTFRAHPPTGNGEILDTDRLFIGEDDNSGGGSEAGLDASETYTLDFAGFEPHPQQGFHVKLTINAEGSQGADVKHKVFWVEPCPPKPTPTDTPKPTPSESVKTPAPSESVKTPAPSESVKTPAAVPTEVPAGADGAGGAGSAAGLLGLAVVAGGAVAGTAVFARRRFLHDS
jgi:hypothetical protein